MFMFLLRETLKHVFKPTTCSVKEVVAGNPFLSSIFRNVLSLKDCCAPRGIRTRDRLLKRELLYRLSYGRNCVAIVANCVKNYTMEHT